MDFEEFPPTGLIEMCGGVQLDHCWGPPYKIFLNVQIAMLGERFGLDSIVTLKNMFTFVFVHSKSKSYNYRTLIKELVVEIVF